MSSSVECLLRQLVIPMCLQSKYQWVIMIWFQTVLKWYELQKVGGNTAEKWLPDNVFKAVENIAITKTSFYPYITIWWYNWMCHDVSLAPCVPCLSYQIFHSHHKRKWRGALMFSLICAWTNSWANNGDASDLRRYRARYDFTVMYHTVVRISANYEVMVDQTGFLQSYETVSSWWN